MLKEDSCLVYQEDKFRAAVFMIFKISGNTVEFVRDLRYNKHRMLLKNAERKKNTERVWLDDRHCTCKTGIRKISG